MSLPVEFAINKEGSFGWQTFHRRHPALIEKLCASIPYSSQQRDALQMLLDESRFGIMRPPTTGLHMEDLLSQGASYFHRPWAEVPFLWAESYFFRRLLESVDYWTPGPWQGLDPFAIMKSSELQGVLATDFSWTDEVANELSFETFSAFVRASLNGNKADLSFLIDRSISSADDHLLVDNTNELWSYLCSNKPAQVVIVLDNAGKELLSDLLLASFLFEYDLASVVRLHIKPAPYYVSDATISDVRDCLNKLALLNRPCEIAFNCIQNAAADGRLIIETNPFYCSPLSFHSMPNVLQKTFADALTIFKGDLTYRRLVGDRAWNPTFLFSELTSYIPGPIAAFRTCKSEVAVGIPQEKLDLLDTNWSTTGSYSTIQTRLASNY